MLHFDLGSVSIQQDQAFYKYLTTGFLGGTALVGILCVALSKPITMLLKIPTKVYAPLILLLICWACYQISHTYFDVVTLMVCSAIGIFAKLFELNRPAMLLAFILFAKIEALTYQAVSLYDINSLLQRPLFLVMCLFTMVTVYAGAKYVRNNKGER